MERLEAQCEYERSSDFFSLDTISRAVSRYKVVARTALSVKQGSTFTDRLTCNELLRFIITVVIVA